MLPATSTRTLTWVRPMPAGSYAWGVTVVLHLPDELAAELEREAARRGVSVEELTVEALRGLYGHQTAVDDAAALDAFIGCGASDNRGPFDIHRARADLATRKLAEGA